MKSSLSFKKIETEEKYQDFVENFYFLADKELIKAEGMRKLNDDHNVALVLPKIISIVNIVGYLRGQDNMFLDFRPRTDFQNELYRVEDEFEDRLIKLIDYVKNTKSKDLCKLAIEEYYLKHRSF